MKKTSLSKILVLAVSLCCLLAINVYSQILSEGGGLLKSEPLMSVDNVIKGEDTYVKERLAISTQKATMLFIQGDVKVKALKTNKWIAAKVDMSLSRGNNLKTGKDSWVEIGFGEEFINVIRIKENTHVELTELGPVRIDLLKGEVRSLVEFLSKDTTFEIMTPTAICGARGTGWDTITDGRRVIVNTYESEVYFYPLSKKGTTIDGPLIKAGMRGILEDPTQAVTIKDLPIQRIRDWNIWKEDFLKRREIRQRVGVTEKEVREPAEIKNLEVNKKAKIKNIVKKIEKIKRKQAKLAKIKRLKRNIKRHDRIERVRRKAVKFNKIKKIEKRIEKRIEKIERITKKVEKIRKKTNRHIKLEKIKGKPKAKRRLKD